jgi:hypothetical protein
MKYRIVYDKLVRYNEIVIQSYADTPGLLIEIDEDSSLHLTEQQASDLYELLGDMVQWESSFSTVGALNREAEQIEE